MKARGVWWCQYAFMLRHYPYCTIIGQNKVSISHFVLLASSWFTSTSSSTIIVSVAKLIESTSENRNDSFVNYLSYERILTCICQACEHTFVCPCSGNHDDILLLTRGGWTEWPPLHHVCWWTQSLGQIPEHWDEVRPKNIKEEVNKGEQNFRI